MFLSLGVSKFPSVQVVDVNARVVFTIQSEIEKLADKVEKKVFTFVSRTNPTTSYANEFLVARFYGGMECDS